MRYATDVTRRRPRPLATAVAALRRRRGVRLARRRAQPNAATTRLDAPPTAEFHFARLVYRNSPVQPPRRLRPRRHGAWTTDYPDAEFHVMQGIGRFTGIDTASGRHRRQRRPPDPARRRARVRLSVAVRRRGRPVALDESEAKILREYLDRGGFLMVDDFWGEYQWAIFVDSMQRVFPDRPIEELGEDHELLHVLYDLDQRTQIPGRGGQRARHVPHWRGIFDDDGRLMVAINFNMDMGDAWEHADDPWYPEPMTALAYEFAVNYLIYYDDALSGALRRRSAPQRNGARAMRSPENVPIHASLPTGNTIVALLNAGLASVVAITVSRIVAGSIATAIVGPRARATSRAMSCSGPGRAAALGNVVRHAGRQQSPVGAEMHVVRRERQRPRRPELPRGIAVRERDDRLQPRRRHVDLAAVGRRLRCRCSRAARVPSTSLKPGFAGRPLEHGARRLAIDDGIRERRARHEQHGRDDRAVGERRHAIRREALRASARSRATSTSGRAPVASTSNTSIASRAPCPTT